MKLLRIKDNSKNVKSSFADIPTLTGRIADKTLRQLECEGVLIFPRVLQENEDLTANDMILQSINDTYRTCNVIGYLGYGDERLIIQSRFVDGEDDYFFQYLISRVLDIPQLVELYTDATHNERVFNFLLFLFPRFLKSAMRKDVMKQYVRTPYNDAHLTGTIDIQQHIKINTPFIGRIAYNQREFTADNDLMRLVRYAIEFIKHKPYGAQMLARAQEEVKQVIESTPSYASVSLPKVLYANQKNPVKHAYYREYLALQQLCLMILQHEKHRIGAGTRQIYGVLFDAAWLWEEYVNTLLGGAFHHPMNKGGIGAQRLFHGNRGLIYPDFISRDPLNRIVADAKYKTNDGIGNRDYLQILAYMFRFDAKVGYYFYPEAGGNSNLVLHVNSGSTYESNVTSRDDVKVIKHGLRIPVAAVNFQDFVEQMTSSELSFIQPFTE